MNRCIHFTYLLLVFISSFDVYALPQKDHNDTQPPLTSDPTNSCVELEKDSQSAAVAFIPVEIRKKEFSSKWKRAIGWGISSMLVSLGLEKAFSYGTQRLNISNDKAGLPLPNLLTKICMGLGIGAYTLFTTQTLYPRIYNPQDNTVTIYSASQPAFFSLDYVKHKLGLENIPSKPSLAMKVVGYDENTRRMSLKDRKTLTIEKNDSALHEMLMNKFSSTRQSVA